MEISEIQLLGVLLIIIVFAFIFKVIEGNWALKAEQHALQEEEHEIMPATARLKAKALTRQASPAGKEIRLVPLKPLKESPAAVFSIQQSRSITFSAAKEKEEMLKLVKAR
ncbi:MAG: hypothetical protein JWO09_558 [Bacteroidetes bacterium]|nr:hypothetical protein [Bacteroidota bacterium]